MVGYLEMIKMAGVTVKYPRSALPALNSVELEVKSGQVGVLLGGNNSGKSTLLQYLSGLIPTMQPADISGSFEISGEVDALLQDSDIFLMPTVREELEFPLYKLWRRRKTVTERLWKIIMNRANSIKGFNLASRITPPPPTRLNNKTITSFQSAVLNLS